MDKVKVLAGLALGAIMVSCGNPAKEFKTELEAIDSLQGVVRAYQLAIDSIDTKEMDELAEEVDRQYSFLIQNYKDTADRDFWVHDMSYYKGIMKSFTHFAKGQETVRAELAENAKQLETLENSIKDGKLKKEEVDKYLGQEVGEMQQTQMHYTKIVATLKTQRLLYSEFKPKMDSVEAYVRTSQE